MLKVEIYRYNPDTDSAPRMQTYEIDTQGKDMMVLDVLELLKEQDATLAYRRSCREGVCGSDGMNINGTRRKRKAGWPVRMYFMCVLFHKLSVILVEPRQVHWPGRFAASVSFSSR